MEHIKFRAWKHVNTPEMFNDVQVIDFKSGIAHLGYSLSSFTERTDKERLDNLILMQYTGLKDKNGVEIYEGDIVENASKDLKFQVVYEAPSFNRKWIDDISKRYREHLTESLAWNTYMICEVIGNIYENPELLEDK